MLLAIWVIGVFALSPFAREVQGFAREELGSSLLFQLILFITGALVAVPAFRCRSQLNRSRFLGLAVFAAAAIALALSLRKDPEEAFHLIEYGVMSVLCSRELRRRSATGIAVTAAAITASIGICEELFQWVLPDRYFDFRDIGINALAACIAQGLRLCVVSRPENPAAARYIFSRSVPEALALALSLLFCCVLLTPRAILALIALSPRFASLADEPVVEFGTVIAASPAIRFPSRFTPEQLAGLDETDGRRVSAVLLQPVEEWSRFMAANSALRDPYLHEAAVHRFRRDRSLQSLERNLFDVEALAAAFGEETILRASFPRASESVRLAEDRYNDLRDRGAGLQHYLSPVSSALIVSAPAWFIDAVLSAAIAALLLWRTKLQRGNFPGAKR